MIEVKLSGIEKRYAGAAVEAVRDLSLTVRKGDLVCLLGPSGCGKTTTLKMIAGLLEPDRGSIEFDGVDVTRVPAERRESVMVFQNHLLFPFLTVLDNVGFGLRMRGMPRAEIRRRVTPMLERMQLAGYEERKPAQLSGGQRQRVALARALVLEPKVLLLDEPLSNLDASLRDDMRELILSLKEELDLTIIFVTHDQEEAVLLADRIAVMFDGELAQYATIPELYRRPASVAIARFFGNTNVLDGTVINGAVATAAGRIRVAADSALPEPGASVSVLVRPEEIRLERVGEGGSPQPETAPPGETGATTAGGGAAPGEAGATGATGATQARGGAPPGEAGATGATQARGAAPPERNAIPALVVRHTYMGTHRRSVIEVAGRHWTVVDNSHAAPIEAGERVVASFAREAAWALVE